MEQDERVVVGVAPLEHGQAQALGDVTVLVREAACIAMAKVSGNLMLGQ